MLALPTWLHTLATALTLAGTSVWLIVRWLKVAQVRADTGGCARCELAPRPLVPSVSSGIRSTRLRVLR
jgi:hypothetical protein